MKQSWGLFVLLRKIVLRFDFIAFSLDIDRVVVQFNDLYKNPTFSCVKIRVTSKN